jgi:AraC-like DNA-binding protein
MASAFELEFPVMPQIRRLEPVSREDWARLLASVAIPGEVTLGSCQPPGALKAARLAGGGMLSHLDLAPQEVHHDQAHLPRTSEQNLLVHVVLEGEGMLEQNGVQLPFAAGDITYRNAQLPSWVRFERPSRLVALRLPEHRLKAYLDVDYGRRPRQVRGDSHLGGLIRGFTDYLVGSDVEGAAAHLPALEQALVLMLGSAYLASAAVPLERARLANATRWQQLAAFIQANLCDSQLSPAQCAQGLGISERYIYKLFEERGDKFSRHVLAERLEMARALLGNRRYQSTDVSSIAFQCGFNSLAHFSRCFKERFAVSPSCYRAGTALTP